jgi:hypothetical protein
MADDIVRRTSIMEVTMLRWLSVATVFFIALSSPRSALASDPQKPDKVQPGMGVSITDDTGAVLQGEVTSVTDDVIRIKRRKRLEEVPLSRIVRIEKPDSLRNGALTGLLLGGGLGFIGGMSVMHGEPVPVVLGMMAGNALIYGAVGTAIDAMIPGKRTLYERGRSRETSVAPIVGRGVGGAAFRVSW